MPAFAIKPSSAIGLVLRSFSLISLGLCTYAAACFNLTIPSLPIPFSEVKLSDAELSDNIGQKIQYAKDAINLSPNKAIAEIALVRYLSLKDKNISDEARMHILKSYEKSKYSIYTSNMRLTLIYRNWSAMSSEIKRFAQDEASNFARRKTGREYLEGLQNRVSPDAATAINLAMARSHYLEQIK